VCISLPIISSSIGYYVDGLLLYGYFGWKNKLLSLGTWTKGVSEVRCLPHVYPLLHIVFMVWSLCSTFVFFVSMIIVLNICFLCFNDHCAQHLFSLFQCIVTILAVLCEWH
jgi:hypothetical protein